MQMSAGLPGRPLLMTIHRRRSKFLLNGRLDSASNKNASKSTLFQANCGDWSDYGKLRDFSWIILVDHEPPTIENRHKAPSSWQFSRLLFNGFVAVQILPNHSAIRYQNSIKKAGALSPARMRLTTPHVALSCQSRLPF